MSIAKNALRKAIEERDGIRSRIAELEKTVARARGVVDDADDVLLRHADAEEKSSEAQAKRLQDWITDGCKGRPPANPDDKNMEDMRASAMKAQSAKDAAERALAMVQSTFEEAKAAEKEAANHIEACIKAVLSEEADTIAADVRRMEQAALDLRLKLAAMTTIGTPGNRFEPSSVTMAIITNPPPPLGIQTLLSENPYRQRVQDAASALLSRIAELRVGGDIAGVIL